MALLAQSHRDWGFLVVLPAQNSYVSRGWESLPGFFRSPAPKMRTSLDILQPERASQESCCSASSAHGTAHTEAQRLRLLACLATSNFKYTQGMNGPSPARFISLIQQCERLQITRSQKWLTWKAVAQPHLLMALLA